MYVLYCGPVAFIYSIKFLFYLIDTNFSSLELLVAKILSILLVYSLDSSVYVFLFSLKVFLNFGHKIVNFYPYLII